MKNELILNENEIESKIFTIRGLQVMLDRDLAELYEVETKVLNQAVKRNIERFPEEFMFQLESEEFQNWKSQFVTSNADKMGLRRPPYAFTEQGVAMLSAILRSEVAVQTSIKIINAFVKLRKLIGSANIHPIRISNIENKLIEHDIKIDKLFNALENNTIPTQGIFFDGQIFDAYEFTSKLIRSAKEKIILIDNYIDESTLITLAKKNENVKVVLLTKNVSKQLELDVHKINAQYKNFETRKFEKSHDRFLIIDNMEVYHLGASLKDLGKKWFAFSKLNPDSVENILKRL